MTEKKRNTSPGARLAPVWNRKLTRQVKAELAVRITKKTTGHPLWGKGAFVRHIVVGFFQPVSYCGRFVGDISTSPMPTLIGVSCRSCNRLWNTAMDIHNATVDATNAAYVTTFRAQLADLHDAGDLVEFRRLWYEELGEKKAFRAMLRTELAEHGIVVADVLERVRVELGEPEPWLDFPGDSELS